MSIALFIFFILDGAAYWLALDYGLTSRLWMFLPGGGYVALAWAMWSSQDRESSR